MPSQERRGGSSRWEEESRGVQPWCSQGLQSAGTKPIRSGDKYLVTEVECLAHLGL